MNIDVEFNNRLAGPVAIVLGLVAAFIVKFVMAACEKIKHWWRQ